MDLVIGEAVVVSIWRRNIHSNTEAIMALLLVSLNRLCCLGIKLFSKDFLDSAESGQQVLLEAWFTLS